MHPCTMGEGISIVAGGAELTEASVHNSGEPSNATGWRNPHRGIPALGHGAIQAKHALAYLGGIPALGHGGDFKGALQ